jgi:hypothetical protein
MAAALGFVLGVETELEQGIGVLAAHEGDIAATAAIAAAGTASRNVLLPPEGQAAIAAVACFYKDSDFINKHRKAAGMLATRRPFRKKLRAEQAGPETLNGGVDVDELAHPSAISKFDNTGHFRKQGVVLAPADIVARLQFGAALTDDDAAAGDQLSAENLDAEPLRVRIAPIFGTA